MFGDLIDRDDETASVFDAVERAQHQATLVLIEGPAGIGKTSLVELALERLVTNGVMIRLATAHRLEADRPFGPLLDALDLSLAVQEADEAQAGSPTGLFGLGADIRYRLIDLVCTHIESLATSRRIALCVEDLHECDASVLMALRAVRKRLANFPVLIVATSRPVCMDPESQRVKQQLRHDADVCIDLGPLDEAGIEQLAARALDAGSLGPRLVNSLRRAEGTPLLVFEVVDDLLSQGLIERTNSHVELIGSLDSALGRGPTFDASTARRLERLSTLATSYVKTAAVVGVEFDVRLVAELVGAHGTLIERTLRELSATGFLRGITTPGRFRHELVRSGVERSMDPDDRSATHRRVAEALARTDASPALIASHLEASGTAPAAELRTWLVRAAEEASVRSPATAYRLYSRALDLTGPKDDLWADVLLGCISMAVAAGRLDEAESHGAIAVATWHDPFALSQVNWWLAGVQFLRNQPAAAAILYEQAAHGAATVADAARSQAMGAMCRVIAFDPDLADAAEAAVTTARSSDDPVALTIALMAASRADGFAGKFEAARHRSAACIEWADADLSGEAHRYQPHVIDAIALLDLGHYDACLQTVAAGRQKAIETGTPWSDAIYLAIEALVSLYTGKVNDVAALAEAGLAVAEDAGVRLGALWCHAAAALAHHARGDRIQAANALEAGHVELASDRARLGTDLLTLAESRIALGPHETDQAIELLMGTLEFAHATSSWVLGLEVLVDLIDAALCLGRRELAQAVVGFLDAMGGELEIATLRSVRNTAELAVRTLDARAASEESDLARSDASPAGLIAAELESGWMADYRRTRPLDAARVHLAFALPLRELGAVTESDAIVRRAERTMTDLGAHGWLDVSRARHGSADRRGRPRRTALTGWASLTPTERFVLGKLAEGASNRAIAAAGGMSPRTVETHVSRMLRKLSCRSRSELIAHWLRQGEANNTETTR